MVSVGVLYALLVVKFVCGLGCAVWLLMLFGS